MAEMEAPAAGGTAAGAGDTSAAERRRQYRARPRAATLPRIVETVMATVSTGETTALQVIVRQFSGRRVIALAVAVRPRGSAELVATGSGVAVPLHALDALITALAEARDELAEHSAKACA